MCRSTRWHTAWTALGLTIADPDALALSQADVDGLAAWVAIKAVVATTALAFLRILGNAYGPGRRSGRDDGAHGAARLLMAISDDELTTAKAYRSMAEMVPSLRTLIDAVLPTAYRQRPNAFRRRHHRRVGESSRAASDSPICRASPR